MTRWPSDPIVRVLLARADTTRPPRRRGRSRHGLPVALVDLAAVAGVSHGSVSNLITRGSVTTQTALVWARRLGVDPVDLWPGFVDVPPERRCEVVGCARLVSGARSTLCKPCRELRRRRATRLEVVVQRYGDQWIADVSVVGSGGLDHVATEKRATAEACERWAISTFGDRVAVLRRWSPDGSTPDERTTPVGSNLRGVLAAIEVENAVARPLQGPPDKGRPCEAWACPRGDADPVSGLCGFHAGRETNRAAAHRFGRGTGPQVTS